MEILNARNRWPEADALFLPTNDYLWMAAGPALDVKNAAGEDVELAAVRQGPIAAGEVVLTEAGKLSLAGIVHGAVMGQDLLLDGDAAAQALQACLKLSEAKRWSHLLVHSLYGTGRGTRRESVQKALGAMVDSLLGGGSIRQIGLLSLDEGERKLLHEDLLRLIQLQG